MKQPKMFVMLENEKELYKLIKSICGLKQAHKQWHEKLESILLSSGLRYNNTDKFTNAKFTQVYCLE